MRLNSQPIPKIITFKTLSLFFIQYTAQTGNERITLS